MRYVTSTLAAMTLASAVGVLAQEQQAPAQAPAREQAAPKEQAPGEQPAATQQTSPKFTLTGCVVEAKTTDGGTVYVLSKAEGGKATMYVLAGPSEKDFSTNVNKKIEVIGPVKEPPNADTDSAPNAKVVRPPAVFVESVKLVAESCA